jgi:hypothetical protein
MTDGFARDADRQTAWAGYLRKERIDTVPSSFEAVMPVIWAVCRSAVSRGE